MTVGEKIKHYRKSLNLTQNQLAELSGIHLVSIAKYETNKMQPQPPQLKRIASALSLNPYALLDLDFNDGVQDESDVIGLIIQFLKNKIMTYEGERLEDGSLDPDTARLLFDEYFMGLIGATAVGGGIKDRWARLPFHKDEINANKIRLRPYTAPMEEVLLRWEQAQYFYKQAKYAYEKEPSSENFSKMNICQDERDQIEISYFSKKCYTTFLAEET